MHRTQPPFRSDHVGSLLRPANLMQARAEHARGEIDADALRAVEDKAIADVVRKQENVGLPCVTDGEFRRAYFHLDFLQQLDGVSVTGGISANPNAKSSDDGFTPPKLSVTGKLAHARNIQVADYRYLAAHSGVMPKVSIPSPTMVHFRGGRAAIDIEAYPELDGFFEDLAQCYRDEIAALHDAGCRYIQLDDTNLAYLCDPDMRAAAADRGDDDVGAAAVRGEVGGARVADGHRRVHRLQQVGDGHADDVRAAEHHHLLAAHRDARALQQLDAAGGRARQRERRAAAAQAHVADVLRREAVDVLPHLDRLEHARLVDVLR